MRVVCPSREAAYIRKKLIPRKLWKNSCCCGIVFYKRDASVWTLCSTQDPLFVAIAEPYLRERDLLGVFGALIIAFVLSRAEIDMFIIPTDKILPGNVSGA